MVMKRYFLASSILFSQWLSPWSTLYASDDVNRPKVSKTDLIQRWKDRKDLPHVDETGKVVYFYGGSLPTIVCSPTHTCALELQEGENISPNGVNAGDTIRWEIDITSKGSGPQKTPLLIIKPIAAGVKTNLLVVTDKRTYNIKLISRQNDWMPLVSFDYPSELSDQIKDLKASEKLPDDINPANSESDYLDQLDFNYEIYGNANWKPLQVYNNGKTTFILLPSQLPADKVPALVVQDSRNSTHNDSIYYRYANQRLIINDVFDKALLVSGTNNQQKVIIKYTPKEP